MKMIFLIDDQMLYVQFSIVRQDTNVQYVNLSRVLCPNNITNQDLLGHPVDADFAQVHDTFRLTLCYTLRTRVVY